MSSNVPAIITSEIALLRVATEKGISSAEAHFWDLVTWVLISRSRGQRLDGVAGKAITRGIKALSVATSAAELDEVDGLGISAHNIVVVGVTRVDVKSNLLLLVHVGG